MVEELPYRELRGPLLWLFALLTLVVNLLVLNQLLNLGFLVKFTLIENRYLYLLAAFTLPLAYLAYPLSPQRGTSLAWYDLLAAFLCLAAGGYFAWNGERILAQGWEYSAPVVAIAMSGVLWLLVIEAVRRTGGLPIAVIIVIVSLYPVVADKMPGPIAGLSQTLPDTIAYHVLSAESAFGIPMRAFGELVVGFIVFGVALNHTGGGKFFNDVAFALVGHIRGGAAQVGIVSSALQGSISGSVISNVISSGVVTIPAMKRTGFTPKYAGAVEAVASTGAVLMPPVMGSTAFVMASFLGISYGEIALAAAIPALLFYFGLMVQVDAYAARRNLQGMSPAELPKLGPTLREGWVYIAVFAVLIYFMINEKQEALAPYYATGLLLVINQCMPRHRMNVTRFLDYIAATGRGLAEIVAILAGVGFIIGAFSVTGLAGTLANDLVYLAGNAPFVLLVMGAVTSFIFGMGMTVTACYIFLAIVLAPPLVKAGMDPLAVHLFIMYWGMVSFITPPVALASFAAAPIARCSPFAVGFEAMRMGSVMYFVPFFFVLNPALILRGPLEEIVIVTVTAIVGILFIGAAIQGYLIGVGPAEGSPRGMLARVLLFVSGLLFAVPGGPGVGLGHVELALLATALAIPAILLIRQHRPAAPAAQGPSATS
ncbi:MAG: TRAP transporter fused permease subunit [Alphaproteobacteria bacterium]|nr:TRAP transporter fused permease subunit [Alphaproteobacteria bacterium]